MKKITVMLSCLVIASAAMAQTTDRKLSVSLNAGLNDYHGEFNQQWFNTQKAARGNAGLGLAYSLTPFFNLAIMANYGHLGNSGLGYDGFNAEMIHANVQARLKFNNGKWIKEDAMMQPYIGIGGGFANFKSIRNYLPGNDLTANASIGFNVMFTPIFGLNYNMNYALQGSDRRDGVSFNKNADINGNDQFIQHSLGLVFNLGKMKDTDGDMVPDKLDKCPNTPQGRRVNLIGMNMGCDVDTDNDGVADFEDKCPAVAGTKGLMGCPDADNDGITDADDACPNEAGVMSAKGCPDTDGDGVKNSDDKCPTVKGLVSFNGCPDADNDGIADGDDVCPTAAGTKAMNGCPDSDGDGVADNKDKCPKIAGTDVNGCPEVKAEVKEVFAKAMKGIQFESGKDVIKKSSFGILDNVAKIMIENPSYLIDINGHTDNAGDDAINLALSQKRAEAVELYLSKKGVSLDRMKPTGFGETQPKATNDTPAGKAENRRVEFIVNF